MTEPCSNNLNPLKLPNEGSRQDQRTADALRPAYAPVDQQQIEDALVFAQGYARHLRFFADNNQANGDWQAFFSRDDASLLAIAATQDLNFYQRRLKAGFDYLNDLQHQGNPTAIKQHLGQLFSALASLVLQLEQLRRHLGEQIALKAILDNAIANQLAGPLRDLIAYYKGFPSSDPTFAAATIDIVILGGEGVAFSRLSNANLPRIWQTVDGQWNGYFAGIAADASVYGASADVFERANHIATHNLFTAIFEQFLTVYARVVSEAKDSLHRHLSDSDQHSPHFALFLAFLHLLDHVRADINTLTQRHLDFYYRDILRLQEKPPLPGKAHVLVDLAKHRDQHAVAAGSLLKAGKDALGKPVFFAADKTLIANKIKISSLKTLYRHGNPTITGSETLAYQHGRIFASPIANSDDGLGAELTSSDGSWGPFFNKRYLQGKLQSINMPMAEIGFAVASHYLYLAEGTRNIELRLPSALPAAILPSDFECAVTVKKTWLLLTASFSNDRRSLKFAVDGDQAPIVGYNGKVHGYQLETDLPVLLVKLRHDPQRNYAYDSLREITLGELRLTVGVTGLKSLSLSNDFGPIDASKAFQPFGALPVAKNQLVIGCQEAFQKQLATLQLNIEWQNQPAPFESGVEIAAAYLQAGDWQALGNQKYPVTSSEFNFNSVVSGRFLDNSDFSQANLYSSGSRNGFIRLQLQQDFGQRAYEVALLDYIRDKTETATAMKMLIDAPSGDVSKVKPDTPPQVPIGPYIARISLDYTASQTIAVGNAGNYSQRLANFFHIAPFGHAEQHAYLPSAADGLYLLPQLVEPATDQAQSAALLIGLTGVEAPQSLSLLFQVADGTADPLSDKPKPNFQWHYLSANRWLPIKAIDIQDDTGEWLKSAIIQLQLPSDIADGNSLLPGDQYWLKVEVDAQSAAVCRLIGIETQAVGATFIDQANDPAYDSSNLPANSIAKLQQPEAAVKALRQPYNGFGGRGNEDDQAFYTRISERLRHKDRAIAQWDYEHLVLEAFPEIFLVKCLNHTEYQGNRYRELAAGHVTLVTLPKLLGQAAADPLRPYTSLNLLKQIEAYLLSRCPGFVELHVKNPEFEEIAVRFNVCFYPGLDTSHYSKLLNEALIRHLSPWAYSDQIAPSFGGKIYRARVLNFVEELPYVDYVSEFRLAHSFIGLDGTAHEIADNSEIVGSKAVSILVSARQHDINVLAAEADVANHLCPCVSS